MKNLHSSALFFVAVVMTCESNANELKLTAVTYPIAQIKEAPTLSSSDANAIQLSKTSDNVWTLNFDRTNRLLAEVSIGLKEPPQGYKTASLTFDFPFYWTSSSWQTLAIAATNEDAFETAVIKFLKYANGTGGELSAIVLLHQRARQIWLARLEMLQNNQRAPNKNDVRVLYHYLRSTADLISMRHLRSDAAVQTATHWLKKLIENELEASRLLQGDSMSKQNAVQLIDEIERRNILINNRLSNEITNRVGAFDQKRVVEGCNRSKALFDELDEMSIEWRDRNDPGALFKYRMLINLSVCSARTLLRGGSDFDRDASLNSAIEIHRALVTLTAEMKELNRGPTLRSEAQGRLRDLQNAILAYRPGFAS